MVCANRHSCAILKIQRSVATKMMPRLTSPGRDTKAPLHRCQQALRTVTDQRMLSLGAISAQSYSLDHTYGTGTGYYMYIETSSPQKPGDKARLISSTYSVAAGGSCLQFFYHMWGADTGALNVFLKVNNGIEPSPIWALSRDQGDLWRPARATILAADKFQVSSSPIRDIVISTIGVGLGRFRRCRWSRLSRRHLNR